MIRKMKLEDIDGVYGLICELEEDELPRDEFFGIFTQIVEDEHHVCFVFESNGAVLGLIHLRWEKQLHHAAKIAEVMELCVAGEYRCAGIGKALLSIGREWARDIGCVQLELTCNLNREQAHAFYERENMVKSHFKFSENLVQN